MPSLASNANANYSEQWRWHRQCLACKQLETLPIVDNPTHRCTGILTITSVRCAGMVEFFHFGASQDRGGNFNYLEEKERRGLGC